MVLLFHIVVAISSLVFSGYVFFYPSKQKLNIAYILVALMLSSGFFLVLSKPSHLVSACVSGLIYLGLVLPAIVSARHKLGSIVDE